MEADLFISYSRVDAAFALRLVKDLKSKGFVAWLDQLDIPPGVNWDAQIEDALESASTVIVIISEAARRSDNVKNEISHALELAKTVVPVMVSAGSVPLMIARVQREDFTGDYHRALLKLAQRLSGGTRTGSLRALERNQLGGARGQSAEALGGRRGLASAALGALLLVIAGAGYGLVTWGQAREAAAKNDGTDGSSEEEAPERKAADRLAALDEEAKQPAASDEQRKALDEAKRQHALHSRAPA